MQKKIAILAGDGIGPEVMSQTLRVLDIIAKQYHHKFECFFGKIGGEAYEECGSHCPNETLEFCEQSDAILFGSVGGPVEQQHLEKWKNCEIESLLKLRKHFGLNVNIRPIQIYPGAIEICPLKPDLLENNINIEIFRELTGGLYFGSHKTTMKDGQQIATDECIYTEKQIKSIAHAAFQAAGLRNKKICSVDKANILATSKLWRSIVNDIAKEYPDIELTHMLVDSCAMQMVSNPRQFDVILTENMFGDIISDLAAGLSGSLGLIPSASINHQRFGLYEPIGGSAPDIAKQGIANPSAQILSAAMMLRYSFSMNEEACCIETAVKNTINAGVLTADLSKNNGVSTEIFTNTVISFIKDNNYKPINIA